MSTGEIGVITVVDITEFLEIEERLRQTQKMEAIGTLAGGIAHDFNNILGAVIGYSTLIKDRTMLGSEDAEDINEVLQAARRAKELVTQILTFSRKAQESREPVQFHLVLGEAMRLLRQTIPTTIDIDLNISKERDVVLADPTQLHQVIMNLCTNAYHALGNDGGRMSVSLDTVNGAIKVGRGQQSKGPFVRLVVEDNGEGMSPEVVSKVFEPFFTTKAQGKGTGMGMSVVHGIVQGLGGEINVDSLVGKGTRITVLLPLHEGETQVANEDHTRLSRGTERLLVVDDEPALAKMAEKMLKSLGYKVQQTTSSSEALRMFKENPKSFDMVITDQTMPELSGKDLARELLKIRRDLPLIICTGYSETLTEESAKDAGARALLYKPLEKELLSRVVREVLDKSL